MAAEFKPEIFASRAMCEGNMVVCDVVEEVKFVFAEEQAGGDGVYRRVTPALVEEAPVFVERFEEVDVCFRAEPV